MAMQQERGKMDNRNSTSGEGQRISYQIANRTYYVKVKSAEEEEKIRKAVKYISNSLEPYRLHYKGRDDQDYLAIMLLSSTMRQLEMENSGELGALQNEIESLGGMLEEYLNNLSR